MNRRPSTYLLSSLARALVVAALVAVAGAVIVCVTAPAAGTGGAGPTTAAPPPGSTAPATGTSTNSPPETAPRPDCSHLMLARSPGKGASAPIVCGPGEYRTDVQHRVVLFARCTDVAHWRTDGLTLRTAEGVTVVPECATSAVPSATASTRPSSASATTSTSTPMTTASVSTTATATAARPPMCGTLVAGVRTPQRNPPSCRFDVTTIVTVAASTLDAIRSHTGYALVDATGREVELAQ